MGALTMPQLVFAAVIGGSSEDVRPQAERASARRQPDRAGRECIRAVKKLTGDAPENDPLCSPVG